VRYKWSTIEILLLSRVKTVDRFSKVVGKTG